MENLVDQSGQRVVYPSGRISAANALRFQEQLQTMLPLDAKLPASMVINMSRVDFLDSAGLMALVKVHALAKAKGVQVTLCSIPSSVKIILELTQLDRVFFPVSLRAS